VPFVLPAGKGITFQSKTTGKKTLVYLHDDGELRYLKLT
jgi:hypothetical protein